MSKSLFYRWFGFGTVPKALRAELEAEGLVLCDEGLRTVIVYKKYKSPHAYFGWKRHGWVGFVALTEQRLVSSGYLQDDMNLPFEKMQPETLEYGLQGPECLWLKFEAADFHTDRRGSITCRIHTPMAMQFVDRLQQASGFPPTGTLR